MAENQPLKLNQEEAVQTGAILRRFRNWAKQAPRADLLRLMPQSKESSTSSSK